MPVKIKFYGGCLHGQEQWIQDGQHRIEAYDRRFVRDRMSIYAPERFDMPVATIMDRCSYQIQRYHEHRGNCYREMMIGLLEGTSLLHGEEYELERDMDRIPWKFRTIPSFLYEFDRWYNVRMYLITGRKEFLRDELHLPPSTRSLVDEYGRVRPIAG